MHTSDNEIGKTTQTTKRTLKLKKRDACTCTEILKHTERYTHRHPHDTKKINKNKK